MAANSSYYWCTQTCKSASLMVCYSETKTLKAFDLPQPHTFEAATVWARICNQQGLLEWKQGFLLETQMTASALDSDCGFGSRSGCPFSAGLGEQPRPSTLLACRAAFYAAQPSARLKRGIAGGPGKQRHLPPGPGGGGRPPPRV